MKLGVCTNAQNLSLVEEIRYDYIELPLADVVKLNEEDFEQLKENVFKSSIRVETFNLMLPPLKITGKNVDYDKVKAYLKIAFQRAEVLGGKVIVFGSSSARNVEEFDLEKGMEQIKAYLRMCDEMLQNSPLIIAIEPLRKKESNVINLVSEGATLARSLQLKHVFLLADIFHMEEGNEPLETLLEVKDILKHVHIATKETRCAPSKNDTVYFKKVFEILKKAGYQGRVSIEGSFGDDMKKSAQEAFDVLDALR